LPEFISHQILADIGRLDCIKAEGSGLADPEGRLKSFQDLAHPLSFIERGASHFCLEDELKAKGVQVVLSDLCQQ
jgi:hypothetical protein